MKQLKSFSKILICHLEVTYQEKRLNFAIQALEEVQQYRAIGTLEECRTAREKQIPRKAVHDGCFDSEGIWHEWNGVNGSPYDLCPNCNTNLCCEMPYDNKPKYCKHCGQKLDWSDSE